MVGPGALLHRVIRKGFLEEVIFDLTSEDKKEARHMQIVPGNGKFFAVFHQRPPGGSKWACSETSKAASVAE